MNNMQNDLIQKILDAANIISKTALQGSADHLILSKLNYDNLMKELKKEKRRKKLERILKDL